MATDSMKKIVGSQNSPPILFGYNLLDVNVKANIMMATLAIYLLLAGILYMLLTHLARLAFVKKLFLACHLTRSCFATLAIVCAMDTIFFNEDVSRDLVHGKSVASVLISVVALPFTVVDTVSYFVTGIMSDSKAYIVFLVHHICMVPFYWTSVVTDTGYYFGGAFLLVEIGFAAMPAVLLSGTKFARSLVGKLNCMVGLHLFHLRNVIEIYLWLQLYRNWDTLVKEMPDSVLVGFIVMLGTISVFLTPHWIYSLTDKLILENFTKSPESEKKKQSNGKKNK